MNAVCLSILMTRMSANVLAHIATVEFLLLVGKHMSALPWDMTKRVKSVG